MSDGYRSGASDEPGTTPAGEILPVGTIDRVDHEDEGVYVDLTKDQIKDSPELAEGTTFDDPAYRRNVGDYYGEYY